MITYRVVDRCLNETLSFSSHFECLSCLYAKISGLHKVVSTNIDDHDVTEFIIEGYGD